MKNYPGDLLTNAAKFPGARPTGLKGTLTISFPKSVNTFANTPPFIPLPLFAPALMNNGYRTLLRDLDVKDTTTGLNIGVGQITGQFPEVAAVFPPLFITYLYTDSSGANEATAAFDFKETQYMDIQKALLAGDLLRITNMRFRYRLKVQTGQARDRRVTFFEQDIFGRSQFQQLTLNQYFDPVTNKRSNADVTPIENIDVPVDFFASANSGVCLELPYLHCDVANFYQVTFMVERWFNHVGHNKTLLG